MNSPQSKTTNSLHSDPCFQREVNFLATCSGERERTNMSQAGHFSCEPFFSEWHHFPHNILQIISASRFYDASIY
ncbi:hypothetical protein C0J52_21611 [Blattella germanica]|nr:hypothetical protein C0J52_21611 [Blattella germanica]